VSTRGNGHRRDDGGDADDDPEHGEGRSQRVGAQCLEGGRGLHRPGDRIVGADAPIAEVGTRFANLAMSGSWVTRTMVIPWRLRLLKDGHDLHARSRVEVAGGLVGQDEYRIFDQRPRDGDALLLTARELGGIVQLAVAQAHRAQTRSGPRSRAGTPL
jgi:hypothetical protein